jgi:anaerobic selenocysteine-containing dehydrogenase
MDHWEILCELGARMADTRAEVVDDLMVRGLLRNTTGPGTRCPDVTPDEAFERLHAKRGPLRMIEAMLRIGPHGDRFGEDAEGLNLERLMQAEHGIDLGPLEAGRLPGAMPNERIQLAPPYITADLPRLAAGLEERSRDDRVVLIGRRQVRNMNSWLHNLPALAKGPNRCTLLVHPDDAARFGLVDGGRVRVRSRVGSVEVECRTSDEMMPGVVSLPHGFGHRASGTRISVALERQPGASSNDLTDETVLDVPSGTHVANGIPVELAAAGARAMRTP